MSYELPERYMQDFMKSASVIFDADPENSHAGINSFDFVGR